MKIGGSSLCAKNYCSRYRPAARESQAPDTETTHTKSALDSIVSSLRGPELRSFGEKMLLY
ncbi:MAG TPA: hypothetical protein DCF68_22900 [Cyanothece sp. UBA12306]|nr:hypothetical protein [Cyanothece sp. UBA12306]